jgi:hypothetical protein
MIVLAMVAILCAIILDSKRGGQQATQAEKAPPTPPRHELVAKTQIDDGYYFNGHNINMVLVLRDNTTGKCHAVLKSATGVASLGETACTSAEAQPR